MKQIILVIFLFTISISPVSAEFELKSESSFTPEFNNRFHLGFGLNPSLGRSQDIKAITLSYARQWDHEIWINGLFQSTGIKFKDLANNNQSATALTTDDLQEEAESITTLGIGLGHRSDYIALLLPLNLYEYTEAYATYSTFNEKLSDKSFSGPGLKTKFTIIKPIGEYTHLGVHGEYNFTSYKRAQDNDDESSSERSLNASWMSVGFDLIFFL